MARGSKAKYTSKQQRMAEHIEEGYEKKGVPVEKAEARAWATVNKLTGGGMKKGGSGSKAKAARSRPAARKNARKAGAKGGKARAASTRKAPRTQRAGSKVTPRKTAARRASVKRGSTSSRAKSPTQRGSSRKSTPGRGRRK
jgi:hypothetical protein